MTEALCFLTIREIAARFSKKQLSPIELTESYLERIERLDPILHAYVTITADRARADAKRAEDEIFDQRIRGPLHGVPIALKDVIETAGIRTAAHSRSMLDHVPVADAEVAARLAKSGAVLLGKLGTFELALGGPSTDLPFPLPRNPWGLDRITGGSSSGSGVAVAAGLAAASVGTDSGGSIRNPAAHCGTVGLKPTHGLVSTRGIVPLNYSFEHVGPIAWSVEDAALILDVLAPRADGAAHLPRDGRPSGAPDQPLKGRQIGVVRRFHERDRYASAEMRASFDMAVELLRNLGAEIVDIELSPLDDWRSAFLVGLMSEMYARFEDKLKVHRDDYGAIFKERILPAIFLSAADLARSHELRRLLVVEIDEALNVADALVCPIMLEAAPRVADIPQHSMYKGAYLAAPFNLSGHPAIALRCGVGAGGLPLSLQIAGRRFGEAQLLYLADVFERASGLANRRPPL